MAVSESLMTMPDPDDHRASRGRAFFGRRKGHSLRSHHADLIVRLLPRLAIVLDQPLPSRLMDLFPRPLEAICLEIGFGGGENLVAQATAGPSIGFIGCEPFVNGMAKILAAIEAGGLDNVRLYAGDAVNLLAWLPDASIAKVDLLFPAPFSRRQLLTYKLLGLVEMVFLPVLFFSLFLRDWAESWVIAFVVLYVVVLFFQLFGMTLTLLASTIGARAFSRGRKAVLVVLILLAAGAALQALRGAQDLDLGEIMERLERSSIWQVLRSPFSWFVNALLAETFWPDFVKWGALAVLVDAVLIALIFLLDAQYLETAAAASEKLYQRMQRIRSGQGLMAGASGAGKARFTLPSLPRLQGLGPTLWRQWTTLFRSYVPLLLFLVLFAAAFSPLYLLMAAQGQEERLITPWQAGMLLGFPLLFAPTVLCDFRGDIDRFDVLKSLPIAPLWLALGQLLAPTIFLVILQAVVSLLVQLWLGRVEALLLAAPLLAIPVNFVLFGVENLLFLVYPIRVTGTTPGDLQHSGRHMIVFIAKIFGLMPIASVAFTAAWIINALTRNIAAALAAAWVVTLAAGIGLVPLVVLAFKRFDVARDTPA